MEENILLKIQKGDKQACRAIIEKYKNQVYSLAFRILNNKEDAEEVAQDSFLKAFKSLASFNGNAKFSTWLYRITYNSAISKTRKRQLQYHPIYEINEFNLPVEEFELTLKYIRLEDQRKFLEKALSKLPPDDKALINFYYIEEQSLEEIAQITGLTKGNIKVKIFRIRKILYNNLSSLLDKEMFELI
ncbi:RNA polymerase sigma factor [Flexithrix dorotheae]|uniref:RNA polymerase sigma factor n=1 Tax=Flexithrix dorotheae TaxID=70993 RepID=UPI00036F823E|nr:RNA polymerase sigma factor [Flexithrix dorotheae]